MANSSNWQPRLNAPGDIVTDNDDIAQCITVILTTPKGSDPLRPEFASELWRYVDYPIDQAIPHLVREVVAAIALWEPRIDLVSVKPRLGETGQLIIALYWLYQGQSSTTEVAL